MRRHGGQPSSIETEHQAIHSSRQVAQPVVLVVDDEPLVRRALARELGAGYVVLEASGPVDALALLDQGAGRFAAIVTDLAMDGNPNAGGLELLAEVARRWPLCVRVLVSGSLGTEHGQIGAAHVVIATPWRTGEILAAIERARPA